jgi:predicted acylesterase/phospholipase RssA
MASEYTPGQPYRVLSLDGGGAKGFYTLGVLKEIEAMIGCPLWQKFDLVFGTSTGAIIAALICIGNSVDEIHDLYKEHAPKNMKAKTAAHKTAALKELGTTVFGDLKFDAVKNDLQGEHRPGSWKNRDVQARLRLHDLGCGARLLFRIPLLRADDGGHERR